MNILRCGACHGKSEEKTCSHGAPTRKGGRRCVQCGIQVAAHERLHCLGSFYGPEHEHPLTLLLWHDNENRTRAHVRCETCGKDWSGCIAKRLDSEGIEAWGPVGIQTWSDQ